MLDVFEKNMLKLEAIQSSNDFATVWSANDDETEVSINDTVKDTTGYRYVDPNHVPEALKDNAVIHYMGYEATIASNKLIDVWHAAEELYAQARDYDGDWHYFIEGFEYNGDKGWYDMITGS